MIGVKLLARCVDKKVLENIFDNNNPLGYQVVKQ